MRPSTTAILATAALGLTVAGTASAAELPIAPIGTGEKTCVLGPGADCRGVVHRWTVEHHGNLRKVKFTKADLRGADLRGADLRGADFRGAKLRHADLRGANLKGARLDAPPKTGKRANETPGCAPTCQGADFSNVGFAWANLSYANLSGANLSNAGYQRANLSHANLTRANLHRAYLYFTNLAGANLTRATLVGALVFNTNFTGANLTAALFLQAEIGDVVWNSTTCPNGTVISPGCFPDGRIA